MRALARQHPAHELPRPLRPHPVTLAFAIAAGIGWFGFPGVLGDVAWHLTVGREGFLSPPHVLMYSAVAVNGFVAACAVVYASFRNADGFGAPVVRLRWVRVPLGLRRRGRRRAHCGGGSGARRLLATLRRQGPEHLEPAACDRAGRHDDHRRRTRARARLAHALRDDTDVPGRARRACLPVRRPRAQIDGAARPLPDTWGRTPDFYPFLLALLLPAVFLAAARAFGPGGALGTAIVFMLQHSAILGLLLAAGLRIPTFSPFPLLPALAIEAVLMMRRERSHGLALMAGAAFAVAAIAEESAWMAWVVTKPWPLARVLDAIPQTVSGGRLGGIGARCDEARGCSPRPTWGK